MRKTKLFKTKTSGLKAISLFLLVTLLFSITSVLYSAQLDQNLVDDVVAMITNAKKIQHTVFLLDTSESMNTFAYSDYLETCKDSKANIESAYLLCKDSYNQCRNIEANAMCGVNLGCADILVKCNSIQNTQLAINAFCTKVENVYKEPGKTEVDTGLNGESLKFVGPWDPRKKDYKEDLCFYNWTQDSGGEVFDNTTSGHWTNPEDKDAYHTDRRDWDCMTDGIQQPEERSGLWLNWKYATSLDAIKIILADTHDFSFKPRARGVRECQKINYVPYKQDHVLGKICYEEFITKPTGSGAELKLENIAKFVRANWGREIDDNGGDYYTEADCENSVFTVDIETEITPGNHDINSVEATSVPCDICYDIEGNEVDCEKFSPSISKTNELTEVTGIEAKVVHACCLNFECKNPKCRDDDSTCRSSGSSCVLGYYSDFDQDQNHCCDMLECVENDAGGCPGGTGQFLPGPGKDTTVEFEKSLGMPPLTGSDTFQNVTLKAETAKLEFGTPKTSVDRVIVTIYYGCEGSGKPSIKIGEAEYTEEVTGEAIFTGVDLTGCETSGYKIGGSVQLFHKGITHDTASITLDLKFYLDYTSGSDASVYVLDTGATYYSEFQRVATGEDSDRVNEYECKTTIYHKQSYVKSGGSSGCDWKQITPKQSRCVYPDHTAIAKDQWGSTTKTACSWLCRDDAVYEDVWKCRAFFAQMDNPARNGPGVCMAKCPEGAGSLEKCCECINQHSHLYKELEPPERVKFSTDGGATTKTYNCSVSGFKEGITSDGKRTYTSAYMAEVIEGHIKELGDSSFRLNPIDYTSPYIHETNHWYSNHSLLEKSDSFLKESFTSVFETGKDGERETACIYDLIDSFEDEDCDDCGIGCCSVQVGGGTDYCDYPSFWMKIPKTDGGRLAFEAASISGSNVNEFKNMIKDLKAQGGATLGETLYDIWRYLGGMYSMYDGPYKETTGTQFPSPYLSTDVACFNNNVVVISGGQPQFDDNSYIKTQTSQSDPNPRPWVEPDPNDEPDDAGHRPYYRENWYLTSFENVANFVHTKDFFHKHADCRADNNVNVFGYEVGGTAAGGQDCTINPATCYSNPLCADYESGLNVIDKIDTVSIGEWTLAPLFNKPDNDYLDASALSNAALSTGGKAYSLTADTPYAGETFNDLTSLFNQLKKGTDDDKAAGRPHWTSPMVQPYDAEMKVRGFDGYLPATIPIDGTISRFWFGNLKKYTIDDGASGCNMGFEPGVCAGGEWDKLTIPPADCFYKSDTGSDMDEKFALLMAGGAAKKLEDKIYKTSCGSAPCFTSGARNILYDNGTDMLELKTADPAWFAQKFQMVDPTMDDDKAAQILDYMYGYDAYDEFPPLGDRTHMRYSDVTTFQVDDPFDMSFTAAHKVTIRPLILGAITHSTPIAVYYESTDTVRIFAGANDGMLHSFDENGEEAFGYIPLRVLPAITAFSKKRENVFFSATVDGPITLLHIDRSNDGMINDGEKAYLIFGYRRGAVGYTIIDISELDKPKFVDHIATGSKDGLSFGAVSVFRKCANTVTGCRYADELDYFIAVPGGFDPCHDGTPDNRGTPICNLNAQGYPDPAGARFYIYKLNVKNDKFEQVKEYKWSETGDASWLASSIAASPVPINTRGRLAADTEYVYFYDLSSTVFRVDVRSNDPDDWELKTVFSQRKFANQMNWNDGIRVYNSPNFFPPLEKYKAYGDDGDEIIPIPLVTGNASDTRWDERDKMIVLYDKWGSDENEPMLSYSKTKDVLTEPTGNGGAPWSDVDNWRVNFKNDVTLSVYKHLEKGITAPLILKDVVSGGEIDLMWTTYEPAPFEECRNFGTSFSYDKQLVDGKNIDQKADFSMCSDTGQVSLATSIGVIQTAEGYEATFSAGHEIFKKKKLTIVPNVTNIIKWYELY